MGFIVFISSILAAAGTNSGGGNLVLLFSGLGGLTGLAALITVYVTYRRDRQTAKVEDKSVAITELEKAVPGLGDIIEQWQSVVHQLQTDKDTLRADLEDCRKRLAELEATQ